MKEDKLTEDTASEILGAMKVKPEGTGCCASVLKIGPVWQHQWEECYAPPARALMDALHPDHFGIPFLGAGVGGAYTRAAPHKHQYGVETLAFLSALMDPAGPFKGVLPFLYHATPKEVFEDKGFLIHSALKMQSPGLLWTFLQAARMIWEHTKIFERWCEARKYTNDHIVALYIALTLSKKNDGRYAAIRVGLHGDALGSSPGNPYRLRESFLRGIVEPGGTTHAPYRSWACFPSTESAQSPLPPPQLIEQWVKQFGEIREGA